MSGKVTDGDEPLIGASVKATHQPSGTVYGAVSNVDGLFAIHGMRVGGPYRVEVTYLGFSEYVLDNIYIQLGETYSLNAKLTEDTKTLGEVVVVGSGNSNMSSDRAGAITTINRAGIEATPTISRSMNDVLKLAPQSGITSNGYAVGGGNYRQSYVTVDGAAFNNAFGIGQNLPANGSPVSLDALEQLSVAVTPYDVRQSGFIGGTINAVTRSGDNELKGTAYSYLRNDGLQGKKVGDYELTAQDTKYNTYGLTIGGPIIKNKLFFFVSGEYEDNISAGPSFVLRKSETDEYGKDNIVRPTETDVNNIKNYLIKNYNYDPGRISGYPSETPAYRLLGRLDWNINSNNQLNVRYTRTVSKSVSNPSTSTSPLTTATIFPGGNGIAAGRTRTSDYAMYFESARYFSEYNFSSIAAELNSKIGNLNNMLRFTYSQQDEPRSYVGGTFPSVEILKDGAPYVYFGPDPYTAGNVVGTDTYVATDELSWSGGINNFTLGLQYEYQNSVNGYMQFGNGYYVFSSWDDFVNKNKPAAFAITHSNSADLSQFKSELAFKQYSAYFQDQMNLADNFRLTAGIRLELPTYPSIRETNYNEAFNALNFGGVHYSTAQLPDAQLTFSPRVGFNWDLTGNRKYVLRGGTGLFIGRMPYVWLISAVGNSNVGQTQYYYNTPAEGDGKSGQVDFHTDVRETLQQLYDGKFTPATPVAPSAPTILSEDLKMPSTWKTSLAFDAKLPYDVDFTLEGIYNNDINPVVVTNKGLYENGTVTLNANDTRPTYSYYLSGKNAYVLENNSESKSYYYSITAQLRKKFDFGLDLSFAYTHSEAKAYGDGIGSQVSSAFKTNTYAVNGTNQHELGYGSYVAPDRILASVGYRKEYAKNFASGLYLLYDGSQIGYYYGTNYSYNRYSYVFSSSVVGDGGAESLIYVPATREELDSWTFTDLAGYTGEQQKDDFWAYINQDKYLKSRKGKYTERGGAVMPWHHQLDVKFLQDFYIKVGGKKNTLQLGVDIQNLPNLLNSKWGIYKSVVSSSNLAYKNGEYTFNKVNNEVLTNTYRDCQNFYSTYSIQFSLRYIFN
jgi:hypothetical protein